MGIPRGLGCCHVNEKFLTHLEWASRFGVGALLCALPAFLTSEWITAFLPSIAAFDKSYAAVVFVFTFGYTLGETFQHVFQFACGSLAAAIVPQLAVNTFGADLVAIVLFMAAYTLAVLSLPLQPLTKKFALGLFIHHLMESYRNVYLTGDTNAKLPASTPYQVLFLGCFGAGIAIFMNLIPFPRTAIGDAFRSIQGCVNDIQHAHKYLVKAYIRGANLQDRSRTLQYFNHLTEEIRHLEISLEAAWWEPWAKTRVSKYKAVLSLCHKLRTDLFGMQKALLERKLDTHHVGIMRMTYVSDEDPDSHNEKHTFEMSIDNLNLSCDIALREIQKYVSMDRANQKQGQAQNLTIATMTKQIEDDLNGNSSSNGGYNEDGAFAKLDQAMKIFHSAYACIRHEKQRVEAPDKQRLERDEWLNIFLFSLTSFSQALVDFPGEYAKGLEIAQASRNAFMPETKTIMLNFQKRQFISAAKTSLAITGATLLNWAFFKDSAAFSMAPVIIAYIMGGHIGGSYANTSHRISGLIGGMILSYFFIIFSTQKGQCNLYAIATGFGVLSMLAGFVKADSPSNSYAGIVAAFIQSRIMVKGSESCTVKAEEQLEVVQQVVLACLIVGGVELLLKPASSALFFRKQVMETLNHYNQVSKMVFKKLDPGHRDGKNVDSTLWRVLPSMLDKQDQYLTQATFEPSMWSAPLPHTAYQQLVVCGRRLNLHLILLHRALSRVEEMRDFARNPVPGWDPQQEANPNLLLDQLSIMSDPNQARMDGMGTPLNNMTTLLVSCFDELALELKSNAVTGKSINNSSNNDRENKDEIVASVRDQMELIDDMSKMPESYRDYVRNDWCAVLRDDRSQDNLRHLIDVQLAPPDWWIKVHPTASDQFKQLAEVSQILMKRVYSEDKRFASPLTTAMLGAAPDPQNADLRNQLTRYRNDDLMTFHAIAASLRGFIETLLEYDKLFWGGDAGWVHAQFQ